MNALADACRAAGTWRKYVTEPAGRVQITWQYILFEWNDSDEELALARELARSIDVPITVGHNQRLWGIETIPARVHPKRPASWILPTPSSIWPQMRISTTASLRGASATSKPTAKFRQLVSCYRSRMRQHGGAVIGYRARFRCGRLLHRRSCRIHSLFNISVENKTEQTWDVAGPNYLRLGVLLKTAAGETIRELPGGAVVPAGAARPSGHDTILLPVMCRSNRASISWCLTSFRNGFAGSLTTAHRLWYSRCMLSNRNNRP